MNFSAMPSPVLTARAGAPNQWQKYSWQKNEASQEPRRVGAPPILLSDDLSLFRDSLQQRKTLR
jgi:hypothetical protein